MLVVIDQDNNAYLAACLGWAHAQHRGNNVIRVSNVGNPTTRVRKKTVTKEFTQTREIDVDLIVATRTKEVTIGTPVTKHLATKEVTRSQFDIVTRDVTNEMLASIPVTDWTFTRTVTENIVTVTKMVTRTHTNTRWVTREVTTSLYAGAGWYRYDVVFTGGGGGNNFDLWGTNKATPFGAIQWAYGWKTDGARPWGGNNDFWEFSVVFSDAFNLNVGPSGVTPKINYPTQTNGEKQEFENRSPPRHVDTVTLRAYNVAGTCAGGVMTIYKLPGKVSADDYKGPAHGFVVATSGAGPSPIVNGNNVWTF